MVSDAIDLDSLAHNLRDSGADPERLDLVERARRFKRSWVEMAEGLLMVRESRAFERWGYEDFFDYCEQELRIKKATADKLTASFATLKEHAPQLVTSPEPRAVPAYQSVDYFARALRGQADEEMEVENDGEEVISELRRAVFDEGQSVTELKRQFDPLLYPKPEGADRLQIMKKSESMARKLLTLLEDEDVLSKQVSMDVRESLESMIEELGGQIPTLHAEVYGDKKLKLVKKAG